MTSDQLGTDVFVRLVWDRSHASFDAFVRCHDPIAGLSGLRLDEGDAECEFWLADEEVAEVDELDQSSFAVLAALSNPKWHEIVADARASTSAVSFCAAHLGELAAVYGFDFGSTSCQVGYVVGATVAGIDLQTLSTDGTFDGDSPHFQSSEIALIEFGSRYLRSLDRIHNS